jgi:hypothetical protein
VQTELRNVHPMRVYRWDVGHEVDAGLPA